MEAKLIINKDDYKEYLITKGKHKGKYICYDTKNNKNHLSLCNNAEDWWCERIYANERKNEILNKKEILLITEAVLKCKELLKGEN